MTREEIKKQIEELENQLDEMDDEEEELNEFRKEMRKFRKQMKIMEEETGYTFDEIKELIGLVNGATNVNVNNYIKEDK